MGLKVKNRKSNILKKENNEYDAKQKIKRICLVNTSYSLFLYFLIKNYNDEDIFIFTSYFPETIANNLNHISTPHVAFVDGAKMAPLNSFKGIIDNIRGYIRYFYTYLKLRWFLTIKTFNKNVEVYGHAQTPFSFMFYENKDSYIIEDGLWNYTSEILQTHKINPLIDFLLHCAGIYFLKAGEALGSHKNIKKIYLTQFHNNELIRNKVEVINLEKLWNEKTVDEQKKILEIFNINPAIKSNFNSSSVLLLTQPFFEDGFLSLDEELKIYQEIISKYDSKIIIKPHPRDNKDYTCIFPKIKTIEKNFPIELLTLIGGSVKTVVTISSTSVFSFINAEIDIYSGHINSKKIEMMRNQLKTKINELKM